MIFEVKSNLSLSLSSDPATFHASWILQPVCTTDTSNLTCPSRALHYPHFSQPILNISPFLILLPFIQLPNPETQLPKSLPKNPPLSLKLTYDTLPNLINPIPKPSLKSIPIFRFPLPQHLLPQIPYNLLFFFPSFSLAS